MAKRGRPRKAEEPEQLDLIDIGPKNAKEIVKLARAYKDAQADRMEALNREIELKDKLLVLIKEEGLQYVDGLIRFKVDGASFKVKARKELVQVKFDGEEDEGDDPHDDEEA